MPQHRITTPEQVEFNYTIAGLATRGSAWMIDQLLILAILIICLLAMGFMSVLGFVVVLLTRFALDFGYYTWCEYFYRGQTIGKRKMGIRVMPSEGGRLRFADVLTRTLFRILDNTGLIFFMGVVGGLVAFIDPLSRRLGDLAGDTIVIKDTKAELPPPVLRQRDRVNAYAEDASIRTRISARVTRDERDLIFDLMLRRDDLEPDDREAVFAKAATYFRKRYELPSDLDYLTDEQTVLNLALVLAESRFLG